MVLIIDIDFSSWSWFDWNSLILLIDRSFMERALAEVERFKKQRTTDLKEIFINYAILQIKISKRVSLTNNTIDTLYHCAAILFSLIVGSHSFLSLPNTVTFLSQNALLDRKCDSNYPTIIDYLKIVLELAQNALSKDALLPLCLSVCSLGRPHKNIIHLKCIAMKYMDFVHLILSARPTSVPVTSV